MESLARFQEIDATNLLEMKKNNRQNKTLKQAQKTRRGSRGGEMGEFSPPVFLSPLLSKNSCFSAISIQEKEKTNRGYKHNNKVSHGIFNLAFRMLQHTSSEVTVTKYDEI